MATATAPLTDLLAQFTERLAAIETKLGLEVGAIAAAAGGGGGAAAAGAAPQVTAFDALLSKELAAFVGASGKLGAGIAELGDITKRAFEAQRAFIAMAAACKQAPMEKLKPHLTDLQGALRDAGGSVDPRSDFVQHAKAVNEAIQCSNWLLMPTGAADFANEAIGSSDFWANKIRVEHKATSPDQVAFCTALKALLQGLVAYIKAHHVPGLKWNMQGGDVASYGGGGTSGGAAVAAAAPAPAPPAAAAAAGAKKPATGGAMADVFGGIKSIDQSGGFTAGLKKVSKDQQTWREEYKGDKPVPKAAPKKVAPAKVFGGGAGKPRGPPIAELQRDRWVVENQVGAEVITIPDLIVKQQVYIYNCENATIICEGKCKIIVADKCKKCKVVFDSALSAFELVNCQRMQVQCKGFVPSVAIDKTDGCTVFLSKEARSAQLVTSKSSEMNVSFPKGDTDEWLEQPIPEQFVTIIQDNDTLKSDISELYSH